MKLKKVVLLNLIPHEAPTFKKRAALRAGMGYIAQALNDNGIECRAIDIALGYTFNGLLDAIADYKPGLIGITLLTFRYKDSYGMIARIKQRFPGIQIVCGGAHLSTFREKVLEECGAIDLGVVGEGEETIVSICKEMDPAGIPGLIFRKDGKIMFTGDRPYKENLDGLGFPKYTGFELENYPLKATPVAERIIPIVASRGCPYDCIYCPVKTAIGQKYRARSVAGLITELKYWYALGYRRFSFVDDNFTLQCERIDQFCCEITKNGLTGLTLSLPNGIRADKVDRELLKKMYSVGFRYIGFGVEGGNNRILKNLKKHEKIETIGAAVKNACDLGYYVDLYFILGSPGETKADVMDSVNFSAKHPVENAYYFNLIPYPCTELFDWVKVNGNFIYPYEYYLNRIHSQMNKPVFETREFTGTERAQMLRFTKAAEKNRKISLFMKKHSLNGSLAKALSAVYLSQPFQRLLNDNASAAGLKDKVKKIWQPRSSR